MKYSHVSFSDESSWNSGRYRSISMLTAPRSEALALHHEIGEKLKGSGVIELKWNKVRTAKYRFAAIKVLDCCIPLLAEAKIRVDVLVWDCQDSRHSVPNPDPIVNLQIMYFHLFRNVMARRWPADAIWRHIPDEHTGLDWASVQNYLQSKGVSAVSELCLSDDLISDEPFRISLKRLFRVHEITPCQSQEMCLAQVADIFAGLGVFSRETFDDYISWRSTQGYQATLFDSIKDRSPGTEEKYNVLLHLERCIQRTGLLTGLHKGGLRTMNPCSPLNFWWYEPKSIHDKARSRGQADFR
jgi:hypothetical protein